MKISRILFQHVIGTVALRVIAATGDSPNEIYHAWEAAESVVQRLSRGSIVISYILFNASLPAISDYYLQLLRRRSQQSDFTFSRIEAPDNCGMFGAVAVIAPAAICVYF